MEFYSSVRKYTEKICENLITEDYLLQPVPEVSPGKWHIAHTTWFFETFILKVHQEGYKEFNPHFSYIFNSYYQTIGERNPRNQRALLSRPSVIEVFAYRAYVDSAMIHLYNSQPNLQELIILGLNHEQQHQELLITDLKYSLSLNYPPPTVFSLNENKTIIEKNFYLEIPSGNYKIGFKGNGFHWDNELGEHEQHIPSFKIRESLISNQEFLEFMEDGGYSKFELWHDEGWSWIQENEIKHPLYWKSVDQNWEVYTLGGIEPLNLDSPVTHISFYEASAFASWKKQRLPTEFEWEVASEYFRWGDRWEWTGSAYLPYPNFKKPEGALGEYNGKFMINQMVLRGSSLATPKGHSRNTYRNFFHPHLRWQFTGIRLVK